MKTQKHNAKELEYAKLYCRRAYFKGVKSGCALRGSSTLLLHETVRIMSQALHHASPLHSLSLAQYVTQPL
ncbi:hypothetical protein AT251_09890 [Enterovibrio nigricans]|nr:hypothetical protein [Enterovibrio nigricans]PKF50677.1 hypothetical protein AT251_09890 [Enterovibrio nigricans]